MPTQLAVIFAAVFLAELGDKTQLAAFLFASDGRARPLEVFFAASAALVVSTAIAVALGAFLSRYTEAVPLKLLAGLGFIAIGLWSVFDHFQNAGAGGAA